MSIHIFMKVMSWMILGISLMFFVLTIFFILFKGYVRFKGVRCFLICSVVFEIAMMCHGLLEKNNIVTYVFMMIISLILIYFDKRIKY